MSEKRVVLVIEDEHAISNFICRALSSNDYKPIAAASGKEGLSLFFSHSPDLVLLDLGLPDIDGLDVLSQLSGLPREVPVIIISARDRDWIWERTTTWSSPLACRSCWPASAPPCAGRIG